MRDGEMSIIAPPTQRDGDRNMSNDENDDREYWNGLAITVGVAAALCAALLLCGCSPAARRKPGTMAIKAFRR